MASGGPVAHPALKTVLFSVLVPGTVGVLLPVLLGRSFPGGAGWETSWAAWSGWAAAALGAAGYLRCAYDFVRRGLGTPAITDPPERLVSGGLYRVSRNPMYVSVLLLIGGQGLLFGSWMILVYGSVVWGAFHLFIRLFEEPRLRERFGPEYERYLEEVPRWLGRRRRG